MSGENIKILLLSASSRRGGHTDQVMDFLKEGMGAYWMDLTTRDISYYDYQHQNQGDDFLEIAEKMVEADITLLGTPVYWYSMSAQMKTFLDRWSDLLTIRKELGRALKAKGLGLVSCGSWEEAGEGFGLPVQQTADYMGMQYIGHFHTWISDEEKIMNDSVQKRLNLLQNSLENTINKR